MSAFKSDLLGKIYGPTIILHEDLVYASDLLEVTLTIPRGFVSDLASVPRGLWNLVPPWGYYSPAAVVHDWLYQKQFLNTRKQADQVFLEAMRSIPKCHSWQVAMLYAGVRIGGWWTWRRYRKQNEYEKNKSVGSVGVVPRV